MRWRGWSSQQRVVCGCTVPILWSTVAAVYLACWGRFWVQHLESAHLLPTSLRDGCILVIPGLFLTICLSMGPSFSVDGKPGLCNINKPTLKTIKRKWGTWGVSRCAWATQTGFWAFTHTVPSLAGVQVKEYKKFQSQLCIGVFGIIETTEELENSNPLTLQLWPGRFHLVRLSHFNL